MKKFEYNKDKMEKILEFAVAVNKKRSVRDRQNNDFGNHRIVREAVGKTGEYAASEVYGGESDFSLFENGKVTYTADLDNDQHVKTCSFNERKISDSWTFAKADPIVANPSTNDKVILVYADVDLQNLTGKAEVLGHVFATDLVGLYQPCRSLKLAHKCAIFRKDIEHLIRQPELENQGV